MGPPPTRAFDNLREFCLFWTDDRPHVTCCQFADEEQLTQEPELFVCDTCPVRLQAEALWPANRRAWEVFQAMNRRLVVDAGLAGDVFRRYALGLDLDAQDDLLDRLVLVYDLVCPERTPQGGS